ncbi:hypothetical protein G7Y89_g15664 [Cudoniella acicularis]|uniref:N-acetyltransferase domain-containing protein n=1 Tax=Cudoniella acicularis TaxID=354080 RepID=A0A8H4QI48_9HELO|nr:hypothetical protein G7Y89_g15664 [Cudoniella acicularis]
MTFTLSPATPADIPGILDVYFAAYGDSETLQTLKHTPGVREYFIECYTRSIEERQDVVMVMTEETEPGKRKVGAFAKVSLEKGGQPPTDWRARWRAGLPESLPAEFLEEFWAAISRQRVVVMGERKHRFLEVMATHPECQRKGLASALLKWACERADREGVEFYLDASTKGRPLYEKFGFVAETEKMDPESKSDPMRRPAKVE